MTKRLVYIHPDGLHQILGHAGGLPKLPEVLPKFEVNGRLVPFCSLFKVTQRAAYYKEPLVPAANTFHEAQR